MNDCFAPAPHRSIIGNLLFRFAMGSEDDAWVPYYNFDTLPVPAELLLLDPTLKALSKKRRFHAGILRLPPNTCYNWHTDTDRNVALNMLLCDDGHSKCVFAPGTAGLVMPITELKYKPDTYYVFNTRVMHTVFNFSTKRYLFSVEFLDEDRGLTFEDLCKDIQGLNYVD